jgi:MtN3 and saliva related transmembrane protein
MNIFLIGMTAAIITSSGFIPQVIKVIKTKHTRDVALLQPLVLSIGVTMWTIYGILLQDPVIILANVFALVCNLLLLGMKLRYK